MLQLSDSPCIKPLASLEQAYELCRQITAKYSKTFYLGTLLLPKAKRQAIWAIYVWCRRTDELVDGPQSELTTFDTLDAWEQRLEATFAGRPVDDPDVALVDVIKRFPLDIQPFRDMINGQQMDLYRSRYQTFEELRLYCYRVAGTVGLMSTAVMGLAFPDRLKAPWVNHLDDHQQNPMEDAIALGIANQLTNILRDVGEDARRSRIYIPLEDLALFNYSEQDLFNGVIDDRWRALMQFQIQRARKFYAQAEGGISALSQDARWPVWSALMHYRQILDVIEENQYDVFSQRAYVSTPQKLMYLPISWLRSL